MDFEEKEKVIKPIKNKFNLAKFLLKLSFLCMIVGLVFIIIGYLCGADYRYKIKNSNLFFSHLVPLIATSQESVISEVKIIDDENFAVRTENSENVNNAYISKTRLKDFDNIELYISNANIYFIEDDDFYIEYSYEDISYNPSYTLENGTLIVRDTDNDEINFNLFENSFTENYVKIYVPSNKKLDSVGINGENGDVNIEKLISHNTLLRNSYGDVNIDKLESDEAKIKLNDGDLKLSNSSILEFNIRNSYGDVKIDNTKLKNSLITMSDGDLTLKELEIDEDIEISNSYGDVKLDSINGNIVKLDISDGDLNVNKLKLISELNIKNSYGDINLKNTTANQIITQLNSGDILANDIDVLDYININNEYGDIELKFIDKAKNYNYDIKSEYGEVKINGVQFASNVKLDGGDKSIIIDSSSSDIKIKTN